MDSDSDFEGFPSSQISFCGYENSQSFSYGGDIIDAEEGYENASIVSLECKEKNRIAGETSGVKCGESNGKRIIYDNVAIEDISSDEELDCR